METLENMPERLLGSVLLPLCDVTQKRGEAATQPQGEPVHLLTGSGRKNTFYISKNTFSNFDQYILHVWQIYLLLCRGATQARVEAVHL